MSSNDTHMINLSNYEEWFVLYMDEELTPAQKEMVESFLLQHSQLQEELDLLLSTKLPVDQVNFPGKADLHASAMKLNIVDEALLLYIDNELPAAEKRAVEEKIATDQTYRLQHDILQQTKPDAAELIPYPNKKELYRHTEKVVAFKLWMRIAVAVVLILFATLFFVLNTDKTPATDPIATNTGSGTQKKEQPVSNPVRANTVIDKPAVAVNTTVKTQKTEQPAVKTITAEAKKNKTAPELTEETTAANRQVEIASVDPVVPVKTDVARLTQQPAIAVNKLVANPVVTSETPVSLKPTDTHDVTAVFEGDDKPSRTPAKGFLRKVSRFLERRTGIGTVNADNELLVGAVALKLN